MQYKSIGVVRFRDGSNAWSQAYRRNPSRGWYQFTHLGRPLPRRAWSPYRNTSPWKATHDRLCPQRPVLGSLGRKGEVDATLQARRLSLRSGVASAPGN
jgi:hypothetical protein